jgi:enoyl-CoA hydratase
MSNAVVVEKKDGVMTITINRPEVKNAVNMEVAEGIAAAIDALDLEGDLRAAVLTGAEGTFCSGMDLKAFVAGQLPFLDRRGFAGLVESLPKKPILAAVEGYALAGGFELVLACDLVVASESAKLGIPEVKRGLVAAAGGLMRLPRMIPKKIALEMALTGEFISAPRAYELGLINRIVSPGLALREATNLAAAICANGPLAVQASKQVILESEDWTNDEMFKRQAPFVDKIFGSHDAKEGAQSFKEKRAPNWRGH